MFRFPLPSITLSLLAALLLTLMPLASGQAGGSRWAWFEGTTWYVPTRGLPAAGWLTDEEISVPISDQTVYQIDHFSAGYFTGKTTILLDGEVRQCRWLTGSVTPDGRLLLTFLAPAGEEADPIQGIGQMKKRRGKWTMLNQMDASMAGFHLSHWAEMQTVEPGDPAFALLPGTTESVPEFMSACWTE